jgi:hypothetical protein
MLTIVGWLWRDPHCRTQYRPKHADIWARMIHRNLTLEHRFVVFTDDMNDQFDPLIEKYPLWDDYHLENNAMWRREFPQCYVRLKAFGRDPALRKILGPRYVSIDFDCVVLGDLDPILSRPEPFLIYHRPILVSEDRKDPYNGSMWMMDFGARPKVWEDFKGAESIQAMPQEQRYLMTDQGWMLYKLGLKEPGWGMESGVFMWSWLQHKCLAPPPDCKIVFFNGALKPWNYFWIKDNYR